MFGRNDDFNFILAVDLYKVTHHPQLPKGSEIIHSYLESRGGVFPSTVFFGLQYLIKRYLEGQVITQAKIDEAEEKFIPCFGGANYFNRKGWEHIRLDSTSAARPSQISELIAWLDGETDAHRGSAEQARRTLEVLVAIQESSKIRGVVRAPFGIDDSPLDVMVEAGQI